MTNKNNKKHFFFHAIVLSAILLFAVSGRFLAPHDPTATSLSAMLLPPCPEYPFGTDHLGRCILSRVLYGAPISIFSSLLIVLFAAVLGTILGTAAGYLGNAWDKAVFRLIITFQAFPSFLLAVAIAGMLGNGLCNGILAMVLVLWTAYARLSRSLTARIRNENYLYAARLYGATTPSLLIKYIFPNTMSVLVVKAAQDVGSTILSLSALSFLGLGAGVSTPEWGTMISDARQCLGQAPWCLFFPGLALFLTVICFNNFGDALRKKLEAGS